MKNFDSLGLANVVRGSSKLVGLCSGAAVLLCTSATYLSAEELRIIDALGKTRSVADITAGSAATVNVTLSAGASTVGANAAVNLLNQKNEVVQSATSDTKGTAVFKNVTVGSYKVATPDPKVSLATVQIVPATTGDQGKAGDEERSVNRSMYVAGASAVAGVVGVSIANSGGSDGDSFAAPTSGSGTVGGVKGTTSGGTPLLNPDGSSNEVFETSGAFGTFDTPPNPGTPSPAPTSIVPVTVPTNPTGTTPPLPGGSVPAPTPPTAPPPSNPPPLSGS